MASLVVALLAQGYARQQIGRSSTVPRAAGPPVPGLDQAGPVLDLSGDRPRSASAPNRTVALTFDDGPDPTWTPRILDVLRREGVRATFFVVGSQFTAHPGLVARERREGHEIGSHTFTHARLAALPGWRASLELNLTETAIEGAAGVRTALFRMPYSSGPAQLGGDDYRAALDAARRGYLLVFADGDGRDWGRPGVASIVAAATPQDGQGTVVLLHDGGGDRSQTVRALALLTTELRARGYRFATVSEAFGLAPAPVVPVAKGEHLQGVGLLWALRLAYVLTRLFTVVAVPVAALALLRALALAVFARRHARRPVVSTDRPRPPVSIVVPAYNEEVGIAATVSSLAASEYPSFEIVVVDDGSTDGTAGMVAALDLANVVVLSQANTGKPGALNAGVAHARHSLIVTVDGDTVFERDTLRWLVEPFADPRVGAVSGNTKVGNRRGILGRWQHIEYVMGFNLDRRMYDVLGCMPTVPGAAGAFRREVLRDVGGVSDDTLAEDTDLTMAVNRAGWRVVYEERARAWTEAPLTLGGLWRQRYRWSYGTLQSIWKHRGAIWRRDGGALGRFGLPYLLLFQVLLPVLAPVIDVFALYGLLFLDRRLVAAYWGGFTLVQLGLAVYAFRLDRERLWPIWSLPLQQVVYRQLMYMVVIQSIVSASLGTRLRWQKLHRTGQSAVPTPG